MTDEKRIAKEFQSFRQRIESTKGEALAERSRMTQHERSMDAIDKMHKSAMDIAQRNGKEVSSEQVRREIEQVAYRNDNKK